MLPSKAGIGMTLQPNRHAQKKRPSPPLAWQFLIPEKEEDETTWRDKLFFSDEVSMNQRNGFYDLRHLQERIPHSLGKKIDQHQFLMVSFTDTSNRKSERKDKELTFRPLAF